MEKYDEFDNCQITKLPKFGNLIYYKDPEGFEIWQEYNEDDKIIHYKDSTGNEHWKEYDAEGNLIHYKDSEGREKWFDRVEV